MVAAHLSYSNSVVMNLNPESWIREQTFVLE